MIALGSHLALRQRLERRWRAVFLVFLLAGTTLAVGHILSVGLGRHPSLNFLMVHVYAGSVLLGALAILAAIAGDRRSGAPGDSLHRLGLGEWLAIAAIQPVMYLLYLGLW